MSTAADSFNVFRPNFDPDEEVERQPQQPEEESKQDSSMTKDSNSGAQDSAMKQG